MKWKKKKKKSFIIDLLGLRSFYKSFKSFKLINIGATHLTTLSHATKMIEISQQTFVLGRRLKEVFIVTTSRLPGRL